MAEDSITYKIRKIQDPFRHRIQRDKGIFQVVEGSTYGAPFYCLETL